MMLPTLGAIYNVVNCKTRRARRRRLVPVKKEVELTRQVDDTRTPFGPHQPLASASDDQTRLSHESKDMAAAVDGRHKEPRVPRV